MLAAIFIYWGWDSTVSVNEETEDSTRTPGVAAILSTIILVGIYVVVAIAAISFHGAKFLEDNQIDVLAALGQRRLRLAARQAADHRGADVGVGVDADDDPAVDANGAVDGGSGRVPEADSRASTRST